VGGRREQSRLLPDEFSKTWSISRVSCRKSSEFWHFLLASESGHGNWMEIHQL